MTLVEWGVDSEWRRTHEVLGLFDGRKASAKSRANMTPACRCGTARLASCELIPNPLEPWGSYRGSDNRHAYPYPRPGHIRRRQYNSTWMDRTQGCTMSCRPVPPEALLQWRRQHLRAQHALKGDHDDSKFYRTICPDYTLTYNPLGSHFRDWRRSG